MPDPIKVIEELEDVRDLVLLAIKELHKVAPLDDDENLEDAMQGLDSALESLSLEIEKQEELDKTYDADYVQEV